MRLSAASFAHSLQQLLPLCITPQLLTELLICPSLSPVLHPHRFGYLKNTQGFPITFGALAVFMFAGLCCTYFVPETKGLTLEEINGEEPVKPDVSNKA
jgi:hypothetical protein